MPSSDFTIADVLEWARTKPADARYHYVADCDGLCALDYFLIETGRSEEPAVSTVAWSDRDGNRRDLPDGADDAAVKTPWTYGALVERIEQVSA